MSGSPTPPLLLSAPADSVVARTILALDSLPAEPAWVLIGGVAVFLRLGAVTRPTADGDTIARSQRQLLDRLDGDAAIKVISGGKLSIETSHGPAKVDVMDLADDPLPLDQERRMFALARRAALASAAPSRVVVDDAGLDVQIPLATISSLTALKTVSVVRRPHGGHPTKVGSDIHDLVRLVATGADRIAAELCAIDSELASWMGACIEQYFDRDLRYTAKRLRAYDRSPGALALTDDEIAATATLGDAIVDYLGP